MSGGKVRIEWTEDGRRRQRTIGPNSVANRATADRILGELLMRNIRVGASEPEEAAPPDVAQAARRLLLAALDLADAVADLIVDRTGGRKDR